MISTNTEDWHRANQQYLVAALGMVKAALQAHLASSAEQATGMTPVQTGNTGAADILEAARAALPAPAALDTLTNAFNLSSFEQNILLLCAGVELDARFHELIAGIQENSAHIHPTFGLAMTVFEDAHWSAIAPDAPLRYWQLINIMPEQILANSPLRIDENVLHYLTGVPYMDNRLDEILKPVYADDELVPSHQEFSDALVQAYAPGAIGTAPVIILSGTNGADKLSIAAVACTHLGLQLFSLSYLAIPAVVKEAAALARLWNRTAALNACALFVDAAEAGDKLHHQAPAGFLENIQSTLILATDQWKPEIARRQIALKVPKPTLEEQIELWTTHLGADAVQLNGQLHKITMHFDLSAKTIKSASSEVRTNQSAPGLPEKERLSNALWKACCVHTRPKVEQLAQRIEPVANWNDIVLPDVQKKTLKEIVIQVKRRHKVYHEWGFSTGGARGLGISALFTGESGTGKTMAAEVLANELHLDLYRIDLSQVVNKYIGETEKNLKRIFDAAEEGGAILLFDEADALFGKRSDIKDSHDRYSNIEVSYLLQRMEAYGGLAILTTNMKSAIDKAFLRRIRFVVYFPFPDAVLRAEIWRRIFPHNTPIQDLDMEKLSRLNVPGGNIRNIALNAAFLAADEESPVQMTHIARAARSEYTKLEKPLSTVETGGW